MCCEHILWQASACLSLFLTHSLALSQARCWTSSSTSSLAVSIRPVCWMRPALPPFWKKSWRGSSTSTKTGRFIGRLCWFIAQQLSDYCTQCLNSLELTCPIVHCHLNSVRLWAFHLCMSVRFELDLTPSIFNTVKLHNWGGLFYIKIPPRNTVDHQWKERPLYPGCVTTVLVVN